MIAFVNFVKSVTIDNAESKTREQIIEEAIEIHNDAELDDLYVSEDNIPADGEIVESVKWIQE